MRFDGMTGLGRWNTGVLAGLFALSAASSALPQLAASPARFEAPIRAVQLSDGVIRYGVPVTLNGAEALAGLDTGASGLRIMPDAPGRSRLHPLARTETYTFGSGAHLEGTAGQATVSIGAAAAPVTVHLVDQVNCIARQPNCPGRLGLGYGFLGDGLPHEGFRVLIGANMGRTSVDNPLIALGAQRWIIELPRPGEAGDGRLIANPTDEEVKDFTMIRLVGGYREEDGGLHDAIWACLRNPKDESRACGPALMDTGAFSIRLNNTRLPAPWPPGAALVLDFRNDGLTPLASMGLTSGAKAQSIGLATAPVRGEVLQPGVAPYYAFSVLYDPRRRLIGLKARPPMEGLPQALAPEIRR